MPQTGHVRWSFAAQIAATDDDTTLVAAPGAGRRLVVQRLTILVRTANAATFTVEDTAASSPVVCFAAPTSLAVGRYVVEAGPLGVPLTVNTGLQYDCSAAGVACTITGYGYTLEA